MRSRRSTPRSKNGCWTCRARKVKCDECRPICVKCGKRTLEYDYNPRSKPQRRRWSRLATGRGPLKRNDGVILSEVHESSFESPVVAKLSTESSSCGSPTDLLGPNTLSCSSTYRQCSATPNVSIAPIVRKVGGQAELPLNLTPNDWPIPLSHRECQAIRHFFENFIPRMVLKTPRFSLYTVLLRLCTKHALLAYLVVAFSIRDMAHEHDAELNIVAIEHYRKSLAMFIEHLGASDRELWVTFPALWLFIHYEQQYGESPRPLQRHLEGVRGVIESHGYALFPGLDGGSTTINVAGEEIPRQILDRLALWTIYHDAAAATFGFGGSIIRLIKEQYPVVIARIRPSPSIVINGAWGNDYPPEEELWDRQMSPIQNLIHESIMLKYKLSLLMQRKDITADAEILISIGRELKQLEENYSSLIEAALSRKIERNVIQSNMCVAAATYLAVVIQFERPVSGTYPSVAVSKTLQTCASVHEYEGNGYMWMVAWPMFVAGLETDDLINQSWLPQRFNTIRGRNMQRAAIILKAVFLEKRKMKGSVDYLSWNRTGRFQGFVI